MRTYEETVALWRKSCSWRRNKKNPLWATGVSSYFAGLQISNLIRSSILCLANYCDVLENVLSYLKMKLLALYDTENNWLELIRSRKSCCDILTGEYLTTAFYPTTLPFERVLRAFSSSELHQYKQCEEVSLRKNVIVHWLKCSGATLYGANYAHSSYRTEGRSKLTRQCLNVFFTPVYEKLKK